jgi:hypothetical protein
MITSPHVRLRIVARSPRGLECCFLARSRENSILVYAHLCSSFSLASIALSGICCTVVAIIYFSVSTRHVERGEDMTSMILPA